jgi:NAD(P)-dependent dehydrogenase (short-subunit alcohol dehydrogenase family)
MVKPVRDQVVVITGASSGIGRQTALAFAREGARLVLAARNREALEEVAAEVERLGSEAAVAVTDVAEWKDVEALAATASASFGRIDTWINAAAVSEYATVDQMTPEEFDRIIRVNLLGQMYGCKAVLPYLKQEGAGTIINVASALAERSVPLQSAYCASKHGVKGFTEALRLELDRETPEIKVCLVEPSSINTPLFDNARSRVGVKPMPIPPIYEPVVVAESLLELARNPQRDVVVGGAGKLLTLMERLSPGAVDWYMLQKDRMFRQQLTDNPKTDGDNLFEPSHGAGAATGDFGAGSKSTSLYTRYLELHPTRKGLLGGAAILTVGALALRAAR